MLGILMFCCRVRSRRQLNRVSQSEKFLSNWCKLCGARTDSVAHPDTMIYLLKQLDNRQLHEVSAEMIRHVIRTKRLAGAFPHGYLMLAIDAAGIFSSRQFHCKQCLTQQHEDGDYDKQDCELRAFKRLAKRR